MAFYALRNTHAYQLYHIRDADDMNCGEGDLRQRCFNNYEEDICDKLLIIIETAEQIHH